MIKTALYKLGKKDVKKLQKYQNHENKQIKSIAKKLNRILEYAKKRE